VDELDPAHRPLYLLTPSLEVLRYSRGGQLRAVTNLGDRQPAKPAPTAKASPVLHEVRCASLGFQPSVATLAH
jgi:hypothetical protein